MYKALLSTAYFGLFRVGELTLSNHIIKLVDVRVGKNKNKLLFILHLSKTHGKNVMPQTVKINSIDFEPTGHKHRCQSKERMHDFQFCPYQLLHDYVAVRKVGISPLEQFFVLQDQTPVTPAMFRSVLKRLLLLNGFDASLYSCHSTRIGRASDLMELHNLSVESIKKLGRWHSNIVYNYIRL